MVNSGYAFWHRWMVAYALPSSRCGMRPRVLSASAAVLMVLRRAADNIGEHHIRRGPAAAAGAGFLLVGQALAPARILYAAGAVAGAAIGRMTGSPWMSDRATRYVLAAIRLFAGIRLLLQEAAA